jgi:hypothetical protein
MVEPYMAESYSLNQMPDLARTEEQMLAEIEFEPGVDRARIAAIGPWRSVGHRPANLLPTLRKELSRGARARAARRLRSDRRRQERTGNAYKWGNQRDHDKLLTVTTVMTRIGAVIKIRDQGNGFDVARIVRDRVFTRKGSGMARFRKTSSAISYADGGRTLLIRFLCDGKADQGGGIEAAATPAAQSSPCRISLSDLRPGDQVKVKGTLGPRGHVLARKVSVKPLEEPVIEAVVQRVSEKRPAIRLLNLHFLLSQTTTILAADQSPADFGELRAGQVVCLAGRCMPGADFVAVPSQDPARAEGPHLGSARKNRGDRLPAWDLPSYRHHGCRRR